MKVTIAHNNYDETLKTVAQLKKLLQEKGFIFDARYPDVVITVGGDGTLINAFHRYENQVDSVRFIGIHTGHLGFYTDWRNYDIEIMVDENTSSTGIVTRMESFSDIIEGRIYI